MGSRRRSLLPRRPKAGAPTTVAAPILPADLSGAVRDPLDAPPAPLQGEVVPEAPPEAEEPEVTAPTIREPPRPKAVYTPARRMLTRGQQFPRPPRPSDLEIELALGLRVAFYAGMMSLLAMAVGATVLFLLRHEWMALLGL